MIRNKTNAITINEITAAINFPNNTPPGAHLSISETPAASSAGFSRTGVIISPTSELIIAPNAPPIMTPILF
jgi:hypothetical protein